MCSSFPVFFFFFFAFAFAFAFCLCILLLTIMFLVSSPEFVNFYLGNETETETVRKNKKAKNMLWDEPLIFYCIIYI